MQLREREEEVALLRQEFQDKESILHDTASEKDFYYSKLRNVELLC